MQPCTRNGVPGMKWRVLAAAMLLVFGGAQTARAQYFGQNKVQYKDFDFKVLATEHFDIYYYGEEATAAQIAGRMAERWYSRLRTVLDHDLSSRQPLILYAAHPHFQQTNVLSGDIGEGTGGVTESAKRRIILPFAGGLAETDHVLGHEIVHAFQYDIAATMSADGRSMTGMMAMPLWFVEGMAEYLSLGPIDANTAMWVRDASSREKMPTFAQLDDPDFFPYRYGHAFWAFVAARWGDDAVGNMLRAAAAGGSIDLAVQKVLGIERDEFTKAWHEETRRTYAPFFETTRSPTAVARTLITSEKGGGDMNLAPALSPDGKKVVFLSERSLFAIDMYVADVATGTVTRHLVKTAGDPHFESLQFIESAGDWAPDNRRFAFAALSAGHPVLTIVDTTNGRRESEEAFQSLDQIFNPAWSPDGNRVAFTGMVGGLLDLYLFDLDSKQLTKLTDDNFADYDPEWAPDGKSLAWVTDRFSADTTVLSYGGYQIGLIDVATKQARRIAGFDKGRNTNPEFSSDGASLFFIGTPDGIANVYRVPLAGGEPVGITNVLSGVSGITPLTPALSVSSKADTLVFTVFENNHYNLYANDRASQMGASGAGTAERDAAILPPFTRTGGDVARLLQTPSLGLPAVVEEPVRDYSASLSLDQIAQPTVGVGVDRFGAYGGGGIALIWSDMLGNHQLATAFQVTNRFDEFGAAVAYFNREHRWNWGVMGEQTPYVTGGYTQFLTTLNGQTVVAEQALRVTQINRAVTGLLQYPISRAQRVELAGGGRQISFDREIHTQFFSPVTGQMVDEREQELPAADSLNLGEAGAALVYDSAIMGATSPIMGQRYRFEYTQTAGSLRFGGVLADYRRYFMPVRPFTLAFRGMHYGRYGRDGEDVRLSPLYLGYPGLVRGYEVESFDAIECGNAPGGTCPVFDQLVGSRIAIGSAEVRFPLVGVFNRRTYYGPLPIEIAFFGDAGVAWTGDFSPRFAGGDRDVVKSAGAAIRFNLLGYLIGEIDYVKPFDRPLQGWKWQFNFIPGF